MSLKLQQLLYGRNGHKILGPLTAELRPGELVGVVGPNGSGKSTLLRLIYGYLKPSDGDIYLEEVSVQKINPRQLAARMGACPQQAEASLDFSVEQALAISSLKSSKISTSRLQSLAFLNLEMLLNKSLSELSGGEQQRVRLGRALMPDPPWLVLDEPTNHLDIATSWALMTYLRQPREGGVIVAIHDLNLAVNFCHRLLVLDKGSLVALLPPSQALEREILAKVFSLRGSVEQRGKGYSLQIEGILG